MRMKAKVVLCVTLILCMAFTAGAFAQEGFVNGSIVWQGWLHGRELQVEGVVITAFDSLNSEAGRDTSSAQGLFDFALLPGIYHLTFIKTGYRDTVLNNINIVDAETTAVSMHPQWINNCHYHPGDINGNNIFNGIDVVYGVRYFKGGPPPPYSCECTPGSTWYVAGDVNWSCSFSGLDIAYMVRYQGHGGPNISACPCCPPAP
jgi:hypothetical protein